MCFQEIPCTLCSSQTSISKGRIHFLIKFIRHCHRSAKISCCRCGNRCHNQRIGFLLRHNITREILTGYFVIDPAGRRLHFQHPVQFILHFIQNIRDIVAAFRNTDIVPISTWLCSICIQQIRNRLCARYYITAIVTGIMPTAAYINGFRGTIDRCLCCMAGSMSKGGILYLCSAALQIQHLDRIFQKRLINGIGNGKGIGSIQTAAGNIIRARIRYF